MLGINLMFAGLALTLNGASYFVNFDNKVRAIANILIGIVIGINAIFQVAQADCNVTFGFSAIMWMFSLNYFIIAAHIFFKSENWKVFGLYALFAAIVSFVFAGDAVFALQHGAPRVMVYLWFMWAILWAQSFLALLFEIKIIDKFSPHILILNGIASTFVPGILILLGVIL
ncbi:MAG: hypothetical protein FWB96_09515 [Defluviitaleaceae bacterium]|nr:hypothetical protein [Defluviitaleaceae bacterium]MCL2263054.1 hypothetical protein [Defluviitaleaceae bacterium]